MLKRGRNILSRINKKIVFLVVFILFLVVIIHYAVRLNITGNWEGIFLLRGERGDLIELKDDLYLGEGRRYILGIDLDYAKQWVRRLIKAGTIREPYLYFEWNEKKGDGFVRNYLPGGKQLLTCFSRFVDDGGRELTGLFVGGGLPSNVKGDNLVKMNETGMAYYDGLRWFHIWCNVNEAIFTNRLETLLPSSWKYLGSRILHQEEKALVLESSHEVMIDDVPVRIDRRAHFRAGETFFVLSVIMKNTGNKPATYYYNYGDEPWLGNYGTAGGNVGWAADGLHNYAGLLDTKKNHYAGLFDFGNDAIGEKHHFTRAANFIQWFGDAEPFVYFSNSPSDSLRTLIRDEKLPLNSNTTFIGILWGPRTLQPNQSETYVMAIGMAGLDPKSGFPVKPEIDLNNFP